MSLSINRDFGHGNRSTAHYLDHSNADPGLYVVELTATDSHGPTTACAQQLIYPRASDASEIYKQEMVVLVPVQKVAA